jgi:hypothetical protein
MISNRVIIITRHTLLLIGLEVLPMGRIVAQEGGEEGQGTGEPQTRVRNGLHLII